ncbi:DUF4912 domain-containing protein [Oscillatoria sp. FACHB-1406]|uniref:DUF4912 domain-containing protein n=1 Tax=Oscillatoria sp. FACHB-1406 TaxID=2692846 RepID=UPI001688F4DF|nr:DUF4912 domain-containing protein [Oscillatoria sp. FACHB-1406]MBD2580486.1 DUF4912 domain-containing protein [Oscillatoria sp. FACHB-1406]
MLKNKVSLATLAVWAMLATVPKPSEATKLNILLLGQSPSSSFSVPDWQTPAENATATDSETSSSNTILLAQTPSPAESGSSPNDASPAQTTDGTATPGAENQGSFPWGWLLAPLGLLGLLLWWLKDKDSEPNTPEPSGTAIPPAATTETVNPPTPATPAETIDSSAPVTTAGTINPPPGVSDSVVSESPNTAIDNSTVIQPSVTEVVPADTGSNLPLDAAIAGGAGLAGAAMGDPTQDDEAAAMPATPTDTAAGFPSDPDWEGTPEMVGVDGAENSTGGNWGTTDASGGAAAWENRVGDEPTLPPMEETPPVMTGGSDRDIASSWADKPTLPPPEASQSDDANWVDESVTPADSPATIDSGSSSRWSDEPTLPPPEASERDDANWVDSPTTTDSSFSAEDGGAAAALGAAAGAAAAGTAANWENIENSNPTTEVPAGDSESNVSDPLWPDESEIGGTAAVGAGATGVLDGGTSESAEGTSQRIFLVPQDVHSAYAYWELPEAEKERLRNAGGQQMGLRLCDVTGIDPEGQEPHSWQHYDCTESTQHWDFDIPESDRDYLVEVGYLTGDGEWLLAARSHPIRIPNSQAQFAPSDRTEQLSETARGNAIADELSFSVSSPLVPAAAPGNEALNAEVLLPPPGELWAIANVVASIQGATMPGATVTIDGQRLEVNPDGTFNLPLDLSDGAIDRPILVESTDGIETRLLQVQLNSRSPFDV